MAKNPVEGTREAWYLTNNLRMTRAIKHTSQQDLATKINVSRQTISRKAFPAAPWRPDPWSEAAKDKRRWRRILTPFRL